MKTLFALLILPILMQCHSSPTTSKRSDCSPSPPSESSPLADDALAINEALQQCGENGTIHLAAKTTWTIRSQIDFSPCHACVLKLDGLINVDPTDTAYWKGRPIFKISNVTAAVITSTAKGKIDAKNVRSTEIDSMQIPHLFFINEGSTDIHVSKLHFRNHAGTVFMIKDASNISISDTDMENETPRFGYIMERSNHIYLLNNWMRAGIACISIQQNMSSVHVKDQSCVLRWSDSYIRPSAVDIFYTMAGGAAAKLMYVRDILIDGLRAVGSDIFVVNVDAASWKFHTPLELSNASFRNVQIEREAHTAVILPASYPGEFVAANVMFDKWTGTEYNTTSLSCGLRNGKTCDIKQENWNVTKFSTRVLHTL